jgi:hypothetical protein
MLFIFTFSFIFLVYSHGLRTGIFEASKLVLVNVAPNLPEIQVIFLFLHLFYCIILYYDILVCAVTSQIMM